MRQVQVLLLFLVFVLGVIFIPVCLADQQKKVSGMTGELYVGPYLNLQGKVELPKEVAWKVYGAYVGIDEEGNKQVEDCVSLVLQDAKMKFWPVIVKMDLPAAESLLARFKEIQAIKEKHPQQGKPVSGMQCSLFTTPYKVTSKGKIVLPGDVKCQVYSIYFGVSPEKKKTAEDCFLFVLEQEQKDKKTFWPMVCKMDTTAALGLMSDLKRVVFFKTNTSFKVSKTNKD